MLKAMKRSFLLTAVLAVSLAGSALADTEIYKIDPAHSNIGFSVRHLVSRTHGRFGAYSGSITLDPADQTTTVVDLEIEAASISTLNENRDKHLKSGDFFGVDSFPTMTFKSTAVKPTSAEAGTLIGDLTIKGITKPVELQYTILGMGPGMKGNKLLGLEATGKINRKDFNVLWNHDLDDGKTILGDDVTLEITVEAGTAGTKPPAPKAN
jgi:polyisoprenoid-binding protein YceI